jgi:hypothetical protein
VQGLGRWLVSPCRSLCSLGEEDEGSDSRGVSGKDEGAEERHDRVIVENVVI